MTTIRSRAFFVPWIEKDTRMNVAVIGATGIAGQQFLACPAGRWPLLSAALTACGLLWGRICHHVEREVSRFIPSTLSTSQVIPVVFRWRHSAGQSLNVLVNQPQVFRDVLHGGLKRFVDLLGVDLVVLMDDSVSEPGAGGDS